MNKDFVYRRRLLSLVKLLRELPPRRFNYKSWVGHDWEGKSNLSCGTTACALGWATTIPALRKAGLRLGRNRYNERFVKLSHVADKNCCFESSSDASKHVFGLNYNEHCFLFVPDSILDEKCGPPSWSSSKRVASHIEKFVNERFPEK